MKKPALRKGSAMAIVRNIKAIMAIVIINLMLPSIATAELPSSAKEGLRKYNNAQEFFNRLERNSAGEIVVAGQQGEDIATLCLTNAAELIRDDKLKPSESALALIGGAAGSRVFVRGVLKDDKTGRILDVRYAASKEGIAKGVSRERLLAFMASKEIKVRGTP